MRHAILVSAAAVALLGSAVAASAAVVTFSSYGGAFPLYTLPPGETLYTDFSAGNPGTGGELILGSATTPSQGREGTFVASPATSATTQITGQYFYEIPGATSDFTFDSDVADVSLYIGSLDSTNTIILHTTSGDVTYTGADLAGMGIGVSIPGGAATITASTSNGRFTFTDGSNDITGITLTQGRTISTASFEVAQIATSVRGIPELSTWTMMVAGFLGLGYAAFRRSVKSQKVAEAI
jgi:hypothetical protein